MQPDKPKTAIAEMLKQVKATSTSHDGSEIKALKKNVVLPNSTDPIATAEIAHNTIIKIDPKDCLLWEYKDRPTFDLGNIDLLAEDIKANGQTQPGIVRCLKNNNKKYEIIVGERRWRACQKAGVSFLAIIQNLSDSEAAITQASENLQRKDLSEFAKGMNYARLIDKGIISQSELQQKLNLSKATMSALLSFSAIPQAVTDAVGDFSKVSAHVASLIRAYSNKGQEYISALISIAANIRNGIGSEYLKKLMGHALASSSNEEKISSIRDNEGKELFSFKTKKGKIIGITLHKQVKNMEKLQEILLEFFLYDGVKNELVRSPEQNLENA